MTQHLVDFKTSKEIAQIQAPATLAEASARILSRLPQHTADWCVWKSQYEETIQARISFGSYSEKTENLEVIKHDSQRIPMIFNLGRTPATDMNVSGSVLDNYPDLEEVEKLWASIQNGTFVMMIDLISTTKTNSVPASQTGLRFTVPYGEIMAAQRRRERHGLTNEQIETIVSTHKPLAQEETDSAEAVDARVAELVPA